MFAGMTPEQFIKTWLERFAPQFIENREDDLYRENRAGEDLFNTGELYSSLRQETSINAPSWEFMMKVYFKLYGRYQDMRRDYRGHAGGQDMVNQLKDWAQREGLSKFKRKDYNDAYKDMSDERIKSAIAWGIIKKYNRERPKRRKWWNKGKTRDINRGYRELLKGFREIVLKNMQDVIQNSNS